MLEPGRGLSGSALAALAELEARTVAADGGRLKLEWGTLRARPADRVQDLLWWDGDRLIGFLGLYGFTAPAVELAGMVDPAHRRRGIGGELLDAGRRLAAEQGYTRTLLVVPRGSAGGAALAASRGGTWQHAEHALRLDGPPRAGVEDPRITTRRAVAADLPRLAELLAGAFGGAPRDVAAQLADPGATTMVIERVGAPVGTARLTLDEQGGGVYGLAVDPGLQSQGIGRQALRDLCRQLRAAGAAAVRLEVAVENQRALGLYASLGFRPTAVEDYHQLP